MLGTLDGLYGWIYMWVACGGGVGRQVLWFHHVPTSLFAQERLTLLLLCHKVFLVDVNGAVCLDVEEKLVRVENLDLAPGLDAEQRSYNYDKFKRR